MWTAPDKDALRMPGQGHRKFWQSALHSGGSTTIPRWTPDPVPGTAQHDVSIPDGLAEALRRLAGEQEVSCTTVLLATHAKVIAAVSGELDVTTGTSPPANRRRFRVGSRPYRLPGAR